MSETEKSNYLWIVVGDIHDEPESFARIPEIGEADGVIITGDLTITGGARQAEAVMAAINAHCPVLWAQIGNMDRPEVNAWLEETGCNLHTHTYELAPGVAVFGVGASTFTPFGTPSEFPESTFAEWLEGCWQKARRLETCWIHTPNSCRPTWSGRISKAATSRYPRASLVR